VKRRQDEHEHKDEHDGLSAAKAVFAGRFLVSDRRFLTKDGPPGNQTLFVRRTPCNEYRRTMILSFWAVGLRIARVEPADLPAAV
jgi:hypothetical protein